MPQIQKISVALTPEQVDVLKSAVDSGGYATTSEIIREALRDWQRQRTFRGKELNRLRAHWDEGRTSGPAEELDPQQTREEARRRLRKASRLKQIA